MLQRLEGATDQRTTPQQNIASSGARGDESEPALCGQRSRTLIPLELLEKQRAPMATILDSTVGCGPSRARYARRGIPPSAHHAGSARRRRHSHLQSLAASRCEVQASIHRPRRGTRAACEHKVRRRASRCGGGRRVPRITPQPGLASSGAHGD